MSIEVLKYSWLIPFIPFCSAIFILLFGKRLKPIFSGVMATIAMSSTFAIWLVSFLALTNVHSEEVRRYFSDGYTWMSVGSFHIDLRFMIDPLSLTMVGFISFVASLIHLYSIGYMKGDPKFSRFFGYLNLFAASMFTLVLADNLLVTFLGWEGVGLCSYLLVSFWFEKPSAAVAGKKAFITNRIGDGSKRMRVRALRSCGTYCELRRLTMRGERLLRVRVARRLAAASSNSRNHRRLRLGRSGGKGP